MRINFQKFRMSVSVELELELAYMIDETTRADGINGWITFVQVLDTMMFFQFQVDHAAAPHGSKR